MDGFLARTDLGDYEKARQYVQLQNKYLTFQHQLNSRNQEPKADKEILTNSLTGNLPRSIQEPETSQLTPVQAQAAVPATLVHAPAAIQETPISAPSFVLVATPLKASPPLPTPGILTPLPTMEIPPPLKEKTEINFHEFSLEITWMMMNLNGDLVVFTDINPRNILKTKAINPVILSLFCAVYLG